MAITVKQVCEVLETWAPKGLQENYDNSGLQIGNENDEVNGILLSLDFTEAVVQEAIDNRCNFIIAHHPIFFTGLKRLSGKTAVERIAVLAIKNNLNLYALHTNLDNIATGVNRKIADKLQLKNTSVLQPMKGQLCKLSTFVPIAHHKKVTEALWAAGAGNVGLYSECSFSTQGIGTFKPGEMSVPFIGQAGGQGEEVQEIKVEVLIEVQQQHKILQALNKAHPYEEVAYDVYPLNNVHQNVGAGMLGELPRAMTPDGFLQFLKEKMAVSVIRYTDFEKEIKKVAVCGGSGSFLLPNAIQAGADVLITGDFKYHQFFDADGKIMIADIGHYESEQFTPELIKEYLSIKIPNIALQLTKTLTNPVKYYH